MKNNSNNAQDEPSIFMNAYYRCKLHWPIYFIFLFVAGILAFAYLEITPIKYQASATLIIKDEKKGSEDSKLMESLNVIGSKKIIENEVEVLQSRPLVQNVIAKLCLYAPVYQQKATFGHSLVYNAAPVSIESKFPELIMKDSKLILISYNADNKTVTIDNNYVYPINDWVKTQYGVLKFVPNAAFYNKTDNPYYFKLLTNETISKQVYDNLKIAPANKLSSVISLQFNAHNQKLAEDFLNELIDGYNQSIQNEKSNLAKNSLLFIDNRLKLISADLDNIEAKIKMYKGDKEAVDISTQGQLFLQNVSLNDQRLAEINMKISVVDEIENHLNSSAHKEFVLPVTLGVVDPTVSQLITNLNAYETDYQKLRKTVAENNPILQSLNEQISSTKSKITENMAIYRKSLEMSKDNLIATNHDYNKLLQHIPEKEQALLEISRDKKIKSDIYAFLLQKREESEIAYASTLTENSIVSNAHASSEPVSPNNLMILGSFLFAIIGIPIGVVGVRDRLSNSVSFRKDIENATAYPIIGEVEQVYKQPRKLLNSINEKPNYETFRKIRYALTSTRGIGIKNKKLLITSSISGEGKSYISTNLAISYAEVGKKVVVLDLDFKNPALSNQMNLADEIGITDYLAGSYSEEEVIHELYDHSNIYFVPIGKILDHTTSLLENGAIHQFLSYLEDNFDLIIIDSSPMSYVADAYLLAEVCDTTLFIVKHGYSPKNRIQLFDLDYSTSSKDVVILYNGVRSNNYSSNSFSGYYSAKKQEGSFDDRIKLLN